MSIGFKFNLYRYTGEEDGHDLLERMMAAATQPLRARRIHLGLDEAFGLGQGRYREKRCGTKKKIGFGAECGPTPEASLIYEEHVQRVLDTARGLGLRPAIYTDMIFRFGVGGAGTAGGDGKGDGEGAYRDPDTSLKPDTVARMNAALGEEGLDLVYWDYSSSSKEHYLAQLRKHDPLVTGNNTADGQRGVMMSLGLWTWNRFWAALHWAMATMEAGVAAAQEAGVTGIYVAAWADDGAEHAPISAAAGVAYFAELTRLSPRERSRPNVLQRAEESFPVIMRTGGASFKDVLDTCAIDQAPGVWPNFIRIHPERKKSWKTSPRRKNNL
jgi:hexosaminidase